MTDHAQQLRTIHAHTQLFVKLCKHFTHYRAFFSPTQFTPVNENTCLQSQAISGIMPPVNMMRNPRASPV